MVSKLNLPLLHVKLSVAQGHLGADSRMSE